MVSKYQVVNMDIARSKYIKFDTVIVQATCNKTQEEEFFLG